MAHSPSVDAVSGSVALTNLGSNIIDLFRKVDETLKQSVNGAWPEELFVAESERFELWAANMGLFVVGHGSLDYRVREAEWLAQTLRRFMQDLVNSLDDGTTPPRIYQKSKVLTKARQCSKYAPAPAKRVRLGWLKLAENAQNQR